MEKSPKIIMEKVLENKKALDLFRQEITSFVSEEGATEETAHFPANFNPQELVSEDMDIWREVRSKSITRSGLQRYLDSIVDPQAKKLKEGISESRLVFSLFIANKGGAVVSMKELEEAMERENK